MKCHSKVAQNLTLQYNRKKIIGAGIENPFLPLPLNFFSSIGSGGSDDGDYEKLFRLAEQKQLKVEERKLKSKMGVVPAPVSGNELHPRKKFAASHQTTTYL